MNYRTWILSAGAVAIIVAAGVQHSISSKFLSPKVPNAVQVSQDQDDFSALTLQLRKLESSDDLERESVKTEVINISAKSTTHRQRVISQLLQLVALSRGRDELMKSTRFFEWKAAVEILGQMHASEAIPQLVECLDCNNGVAGLGPGRYPATLAIIMIGREAIPSLGNALRQKAVGIQRMAIEALYGIGGNDAKSALNAAMHDVKDREISRAIRDALRNWPAK